MFANRPIAPGERIVQFEQESQVLVSRSHVERTWSGQDADWFPRYAWPLTDEIYVVWERDPEDWKPINHSCEPNAWLEGLDLVARRDVAAGEEVTVDYATFCNELMPSFDCGCGVPDCGGRSAATTTCSPSSHATTVTSRTTSPRSGVSADSASRARGC
jgi:D-alanine-D-alanine ligase